MSRETRFNLVFLVVLLGLMTPATIILVRKQLRNGDSRLMQSETVRRDFAYMSNVPDAPGVRRLVPPKTAAWLKQLIGERAQLGRSLIRPEEPGGYTPALSDDRLAEVVALKAGPPDVTLWLVLWNIDKTGDPAGLRITARQHGDSTIGQIRSAEKITIPPPVRRELRDMGVADIPDQIGWVKVTFLRDLATDALLELYLHYPTSGDSRIQLFVNWGR